MMNMVTKRTVLGEVVKETLDGLLTDGTTFKVAERFRRTVERGAGQKADRDAIMGSPIRYVRVAHLGESPATEADVTQDLRQVQVPHLFGVFIWFQYQDADTYASSSQSVWDRLIEADDVGLLPTLRLGNHLTTDDNSQMAYLYNPSDVIVPDEPLSMGDEDFCHYAQFFITIK